MPTKTKTIKSKSLSRNAVFDTRNIDEEARTVDLAFSSETPVERWFGEEILDHAPQSVRLGRLTNGAPVLADHNARDQIGVVESALIDSDRVGRAKVRFGQSARAIEIFNDIKDGIRTKISVGYRILKMQLEDPAAEKEVYRATDWEPYEVSVVSVAADDAVGIGRSDNDDENEILIQYEERKMSEETNDVTPSHATQSTIDVKSERTAAVAQERERTKSIMTLAREHKQEELAERFIEQGRSASDFKDVVLAIAEQSRSVTDQTPASQLDLTPEDTQRFSLMKAIRAATSGDWKDAGFERECSIAIADALGREARGFFVPRS